MSYAGMNIVSEAGDEREEDRESTAASGWNPGKVIKAQNTVINELQQRVDTLEQRNKENEQRTKMLETENRELNRKNKKLRKKLEGRRRRTAFSGVDEDDEEESGNRVEVKEEPSGDAVSEDGDGGTGNGTSRPSTSGRSGGIPSAGNTGDKCKPCSVVLTKLSFEDIAKVRLALVRKPTVLKPQKSYGRKRVSKVGKSTAGTNHRLVISKQWVKGHPRQKGYFMCSCGMDFRLKNSARSHVCIKNNSIPNFFKCTKCNKTYDHNSGLKRHYRLVHTLEYKWGKVVCGVCGLRAFDSLKELWKHRLEVHGLRRRNNI